MLSKKGRYTTLVQLRAYMAALKRQYLQKYRSEIHEIWTHVSVYIDTPYDTTPIHQLCIFAEKMQFNHDRWAADSARRR